MFDPILSLLVNIWAILLQRRDIDTLTKELLGHYYLATTSSMTEKTPDLLFDVACQFRTIFDLQRTHLQSWDGPSDDSTSKERVLYLMGYDVVLQAVEFLLNRLAELFQAPSVHDGVATRRVLTQAILSGVRVLCLHPAELATSHQQLIELSNRVLCDGESSTCLSRDEIFMLRVCHHSFVDVPMREKHLRLPGMERKMYPLDKQHLIDEAEKKIKDYRTQFLHNYWVLNDISWGIVGAAIQCRVDKVDASVEKDVHDVAQGVLRLFSEASESLRRSSDDPMPAEASMPAASLESAASLENLSRSLRPLLGYQTDGQPSANPEGTPLHDQQELESLQRFFEKLTDRQQALRDSDEELQEVSSSILRLCTGPETDRVDGGQYIVDCPLTHIITEAQAQEMISDHNISEQLKTEGIARLGGGEQCGECTNPEPVTQLREIRQLSLIKCIVTAVVERLNETRERREEDLYKRLKTTQKVNNPVFVGNDTTNQNLSSPTRPSPETLVPYRSGSQATSTPGSSSGSDRVHTLATGETVPIDAKNSVSFASTAAASEPQPPPSRPRRSSTFGQRLIRRFGGKWWSSLINPQRGGKSEEQPRKLAERRVVFRSYTSQPKD